MRRHTDVSVIAALLLAGPLACAAPPPAPVAAVEPAATERTDGVIAAIRALTGEGAATPDVIRVSGVLPTALAAGAHEYIVQIEGRGPVSIVQTDTDELTLGEHVRLLHGPRTRLSRAGV
jgi:hypothetical protein